MELIDVVENLTDTQLKRILSKSGFIYEEVDHDVYIVTLHGSEVNDFEFNIVLCNYHELLELSANFNDFISLNSLIKWNSKYIAAKAYLEEDNTVTLVMSHYIYGGVTFSNIVKLLAKFHNDIRIFITEIIGV